MFILHKYSEYRRIKAAKSACKRKRLRRNVIIGFLILILTLNILYSNINFLQIKECVIETKCVPTYANIFMGVFEEKQVYLLINQNCNYIYILYIYGLETNYNNLYQKSVRYTPLLSLNSNTFLRHNNKKTALKNNTNFSLCKKPVQNLTEPSIKALRQNKNLQDSEKGVRKGA